MLGYLILGSKVLVHWDEPKTWLGCSVAKALQGIQFSNFWLQFRYSYSIYIQSIYSQKSKYQHQTKLYLLKNKSFSTFFKIRLSLWTWNLVRMRCETSITEARGSHQRTFQRTWMHRHKSDYEKMWNEWQKRYLWCNTLNQISFEMRAANFSMFPIWLSQIFNHRPLFKILENPFCKCIEFRNDSGKVNN